MAVNQQTLEGNWNEIKGQLRERWGQLSQDDLQTAQGNIEQLVGLIQRRTGESRDAVMDYLQELTAQGASAASRATAAVKEYAQQATETVQGSARQAVDTMRTGYEQTERMVRERPAESLAVCFGLGAITGVLVGMMLRSR